MFLTVWVSFTRSFVNSRRAFMCQSLTRGFRLATLKRAVMVALPDVSPISTQLGHSDCQVLGHLSYQGPAPSECSLLNLGGHCALGDLRCSKRFLLLSSPDLCLDTTSSLSTAGSSFDLMAWFLLWWPRKFAFLLCYEGGENALFMITCLIKSD